MRVPCGRRRRNGRRFLRVDDELQHHQHHEQHDDVLELDRGRPAG
jgi:hypothetical protein